MNIFINRFAAYSHSQSLEHKYVLYIYIYWVLYTQLQLMGFDRFFRDNANNVLWCLINSRLKDLVGECICTINAHDRLKFHYAVQSFIFQ